MVAQELIKPNQPYLRDSVCLQTTNDIFNNGYYLQHNDSELFLSNQTALFEPLEFKIPKVIPITLQERDLITESVTQITSSNSTQNHVFIKTTVELEESDSIEDLKKSKVTIKKKIGQVAAGSAAGYAGFIVGAIAGVGISSLFLDRYNFGILFIGIGGGIISSVAASSYVICKIGNTTKYKGSYRHTFAGTMIGFFVGAIYFPITPIVASTGGTISYNLSRKKVK
jgi:hypothetical protein